MKGKQNFTSILGWVLVLVSAYFAFFSYGVFSLLAIISLLIFWNIRKNNKNDPLIISGQYISLVLALYGLFVLFVGLN